MDPARWIIHFEGGGWCYGTDADPSNPLAGPDGCARRAQTATGSSTHLGDECPAPTGLLSADPAENPDFANWTKVFVKGFWQSGRLK